METVTDRMTTEVQRREGIEFVKRVLEAWRESGLTALRHIHCEMQEGHLHITGNVPSFYMKQMAQVLALTIRGVPPIVNKLIVID